MELCEGNGGRSSEISDLPCAIMVNILVRVPKDNHVRCRLVCKEWNRLISEPYFLPMYRALTSTLILFPREGILVGVGSNIELVEHHATYGITRKKLRFDQGSGSYHLQIGNFCNGFVSLFDGSSCVRIWNPIEDGNPIHEQWVGIGESLVNHKGKILWGLGLSPLNEYKLIWIYNRVGTERLQARIHTFGSNLVRNIGEVPYWLNFDFMGVYLDRALHWILSDEDSELICRLDLDTEEFGLLPAPPAFYMRINLKRLYTWSNIGVLDDCLYICASYSGVLNPPIEVWMMKVYGQQDSWVRMFEIKNPMIEWWSPKRYVKLIRVTPEGEIIMACGGQHLLSYDQRTQTHKYLLQSSREVIPIVQDFEAISRGKTAS